jgi:hypothetical protein
MRSIVALIVLTLILTGQVPAAFAAESDLDVAKKFFTTHRIKINSPQARDTEKIINLTPLWKKLGIPSDEIRESEPFDCKGGQGLCEVKDVWVRSSQGKGLACLLIGSGWNYQALFFAKGKAGYRYAGQVSRGVQKYGIDPEVKLFDNDLIGATWMRISGTGVLERVTEIYRISSGAQRFNILGRFTSEFTRSGWARKWDEEILTRYKIQGNRIDINTVITLLVDAEQPLAKKVFKVSLKTQENGLLYLPERSNMSKEVYDALLKVDDETNHIFEPANRTKIYYDLFKAQIDEAARPGSGLQDWHAAFTQDLARELDFEVKK